jgi:hypothetical protein
MENLILCSRILYDRDISDKMKEITSLRKKLRIYETPKIEYSNLEEWDTKKEEAFQIIKNFLDEFINNDDDIKAHIMSCDGFSPSLHTKTAIYIYINRALNLITKENNKYKEWSYNIAYGIADEIEGFFKGLKKTGIWNLIYSQLDSETISNLIYNIIICQFGAVGECGILDDIPIRMCKMCKK